MVLIVFIGMGVADISSRSGESGCGGGEGDMRMRGSRCGVCCIVGEGRHLLFEGGEGRDGVSGTMVATC